MWCIIRVSVSDEIYIEEALCEETLLRQLRDGCICQKVAYAGVHRCEHAVSIARVNAG